MIKKKIVVRGRVQGIGFRPFVAQKADELNIEGWVRNIGGTVEILAAGSVDSVHKLEEAIIQEPPAGSLVTAVESIELGQADYEEEGFRIIQSNVEDTRLLPLIPADLPTCERCKQELHDPDNRRYRHPFISCTACGPRYSIINSIPYDRDTITMKDFEMCPQCYREYTSRGNIRRHAQTIACKECGPRLTFTRINASGTESVKGDEMALEEALELLKAGGIVAVKDIGGYHLVASPFSDMTIAGLRAIKHREKKPFAVCFPTTEMVKEYCKVSREEEDLLELPARPIVLLRRLKEGKRLSEGVCNTSPDIGAMLPCNPIQIMLTEALGPLIMTSANSSGELMTTDNQEMIVWMQHALGKCPEHIKLGVLSHNRRIVTPLDDSILRVVAGRTQTLRRARGFVPDPVPFPADMQIFAAGGDLKACFCYTGQGKAYLSQHFGDLAEESCLNKYHQEIGRMKEIFGFRPELKVCDLHPVYVSARNGKGIQHHKAHVASVIAEHNIEGPVLGFAFDGTGYGDDGSIWGSEVFIYDGGQAEFKRVAHLEPVKLIGGDEGARNTDTILQGYLKSLGLGKAKNPLIDRALDLEINTIKSSSMGRLFDAVSALLDICHYNSYEGEAPIELENLAATTEEVVDLHLGIEMGPDGCYWIKCQELFRDIGQALREDKGEAHTSRAAIARGFIYALANAIVDIAELTVDKATAIVLSGGTFFNRILLERTEELLSQKGYLVYRNQLLPPGDGGLCLGQAYIAAMKSS